MQRQYIYFLIHNCLNYIIQEMKSIVPGNSYHPTLSNVYNFVWAELYETFNKLFYTLFWHCQCWINRVKLLYRMGLKVFFIQTFYSSGDSRVAASKGVNWTCCPFPQTERCKHIASLHSTRVQLRYTGFLLIFYLFDLILQILAYNFYIYMDLAYRAWIVVHLDRRLMDPLCFNNNVSIFINMIHLRMAV
jgi:hypothetical protein